ncbi:MAG: tetratricopeptide (TPR) repeat protein [Myxococcota bacterium]|jgi:tetratricopeptide (TPR) repeat protein
MVVTMFLTMFLATACTSNNSLRRWYAEALEYDRKGMTEQAIDRYEMVLNASPMFEGAQTNLAILKAKQGDSAAALSAVRKELVYHPELPEARLNEALLLQAQGHPDAVRKARALVGNFPNDPKAQLVLGAALLAANDDSDGAFTAFDTVVKTGRQSQKADAYFGRGFVFAARGKYAEAAADFKQVAQLRPDAVAHYNHALMAARQKKFKGAARDLELSAALDSNAVVVPHLAVIVHLSDNNDSAAAEAMKRARQLDQTRPGLDLLDGVLHYRAKRWSAAATSFQAAAANDASAAHFYLALTRLAEDNLDAAHQAFEAAAATASPHPDAAHNRDVLAQLLGK